MIDERCPKCKGKDYQCSCMDIYRLEFKKHKAAIPLKYRQLKFEDISHPQTVESRRKVASYLSDLESNIENGKGIFLYGSTGLAKTGLGCIVLMEAIKLRKTCYFITLDECVDLYAGGWKDEEKRERFTDIVLDVDVLLIDEVGNEGRINNTLVGSCLNDVLRKRNNNMLTTSLTSNLYFDKMKTIYGDEVYSILTECTIPVEFKGIDFRQGIAATE